jgi:adenylosuccinate synthase
VDGKTLDYIPDTPVFARCEPIYETHPGWRRPTTDIRRAEDLPAEARAFVARIEALAGVPVAYVSVGPERHQLIAMPAPNAAGGIQAP